MAQVTLRDVKKVYDGKVVAVRDVNLSIGDGEFLVLVGPSGCGKSTTLRMIAGLEAITEGTISIGDRVVNDVHPKDRDIAMVFQNYALYPHMSVEKNMAFGLQLRKLPKDEIKRRVSETAGLLGISELLDRKPRQLSGGQRQRVALGRAIVRDASVFLFDEPLSNLDAKLRVTTRTEIKKLHKRLQTTTVYVTHDQEEAMTLGDRIVIMSAGRGVGMIEQVDTPLNVYRYPKNRFVGAFLGRTPMNFYDGRLVASEGEVWFVAGPEEKPAIRLAMLPNHIAKLQHRVGEEVTLGLRPSSLSEHPMGKETAAHSTITAEVQVVEPLGKNIDVSCELANGDPMLARIDARQDFPTSGEVRFFVDMAHVHLFERGEFGASLLYPDGAPSPQAGAGV
ncbi:MAG: ABC transporter ATP-binding protein [Phycisphaerales bacterium JB065]